MAVSCKAHIVPWGLYAPAKVVGQANSRDEADAEVSPSVELVNLFSTAKLVRIFCVVKDQAGRFVMDQASLGVKSIQRI